MRKRKVLPFWPAVLMVALLAVQLLAETTTDDNQVECWQVELASDGSESAVWMTASDSACAVKVAFNAVATSFPSNKTIPAVWLTQVLTDTTNALNMPLPPPATLTFAADNAGKYVQIVDTYICVCASRAECVPTVWLLDSTNANRSTAQSGNFSDAGAIYFQSWSEVRTPIAAGEYVLSAQVQILDDTNPYVSYFYAAFTDFTVEGSSVSDEILYDKSTTYCRYSAESPFSQLYTYAEISESTSCEVAVEVISPDVVPVGSAVNVEWTVTLTRNASEEITLPSPLVAMEVASTSTTSSSSSNAETYYEIVSTSIVACEQGVECNEYSTVVNVSTTIQMANFTDNTATFSTDQLALPGTGWYDAFAHVVLAGNTSNHRYDVTTYFRIFVSEANETALVLEETYVKDGKTTYCYEVVASGDATNVSTTSVAAMGSETECPYVITMTLSKRKITTKENLNVNWTIQAQESTSSGTGLADVNLTTPTDIPQMNIYYCDVAVVCTPFSTQKTLLYSSSAKNISGEGSVSFASDSLKFPDEGNYTLMVHTVMPDEADFLRLDTVSVMAIEVTFEQSTNNSATDTESSSNIGLHIGIILGSIAAVALIVFAVIFVRRRRTKQQDDEDMTKASGMFGFRPISFGNTNPPTDSRSTRANSNVSDDSGSFMYIKAERSPVTSVREASLSYDPYNSRRSFPGIAQEDTNYSFVLSDSDHIAIAEPRDFDSL